MQKNSPINSVSTPAQVGRIAASTAKKFGITQEKIAIELDINQSQVSRIFRGQVHRHTNTLEKICNYVRLQRVGVAPEDVRHNATLIDALSDVWDGTEQDAQALAGVIRSLQTLRTPSSK